MKKKTLLIALVLLMVAAPLVGCSSSTPADQSSSANQTPDQVYTFRIATTTARGTGHTDFLYEFQDAIEAKTNQFNIEIYPANQYGPTNEMISAAQSGVIQAVAVPTPNMASIAPMMNLVQCPYAFENSEIMFNMLNDGVDCITNALIDVDLYDIAWCYPGELWMITSKQVNSVADVAGLKLRLGSSNIDMMIAEVFGVSPVSMGAGDIPAAMQQGTIDGAIAGLTVVHSFSLYELGQTLIAIPYVPVPNTLVVNYSWWMDLPEELRTMVRDTMQEVVHGSNKNAIINEQQQIIDDAQAAGCNIIYYNEIADDVSAALMRVHDAFPEMFPELIDAYNEVSARLAQYR